jgi:hypothetical protein
MTFPELLPPPAAAPEKGEDAFAFVCALASAELTPACRERVANWDYQVLDWSEVLCLADRTSTGNRALAALCVRSESASQFVVHRRTGAYYAAF